MIIVNADDWGASTKETDAALRCYEEGRISSASGMVFMEDSERAADIANDIGLDVGLHLNFTQSFTGECRDELLLEYHDRIVRYLTQNKYASLIYNPGLRHQFRYVYEAQLMEFEKIYGKFPSHIDGHHHRHLCANMLYENIMSAGVKVRRNFTYQPGEKSLLNRTYRDLTNQWLARRYRLTDFLFDICATDFSLIAKLAHEATVELMVHPARVEEFEVLMSDDYIENIKKQVVGSYSSF